MQARSVALPRWTGILGLAGLILVLVAGPLVRAGPVGPDQAWHDFLAANQSPIGTGVSLVLNAVGGTLSMTIITLLLVVGLLVGRRIRAAITIGLSVPLGLIASTLIKGAVARPRPSDGIIAVSSDAYPSGHATAAAALTVAVALAFPAVWSWTLATAWILLMAASRTYLLVHWLTDVAAGAILGASIALVVAAAVATVVHAHDGTGPSLKKPSRR